MVRLSRRSALRALPALSTGLVAGLAGCNALSGDDDSIPLATAWQQRVDQPTPPVRPAGGPLLVGSRSPFTDDPLVTALDPATGAERWTVTGQKGEGSPVAVDGDLAVVFSKAGEVVGVDPADGTERWRVEIPAVDRADPGVVAFPAVLLDDLAVVPVSGTEDDVPDRLVGLARADGGEAFVHDLPASTAGAPAAVDGGVVVPLLDGTLRRVDADGREAWRLDEGAAMSSVATTDGTAFVASARERLLAVDAGSGEVRWRGALRNTAFPRPLVADGRVFVGAADYHVYAFDAASGRRQWRRNTGNAVTSGPEMAAGRLVTLSGGEAAVRGRSGTVPFSPTVLAVHGTDGSEVRRQRFEGYLDGGQVQWMSAVDGHVYVGQDRQVIRAEEVAEA